MSLGTGNGLGVQPSKLVRLPLALGTRSATCLPRLMISMVSPLSSHFESRAKSFRKSRTVAVFMVIHLYHERKMSTPKWDVVSVGPKIIDASVKKRMKAALKDIQSGKFAKDWVKEYEGGYKRYNALLKKGEQHPIEKTGAKLRAMMPWMKKHSIKGAQAAY